MEIKPKWKGDEFKFQLLTKAITSKGSEDERLYSLNMSISKLWRYTCNTFVVDKYEGYKKIELITTLSTVF